MLRSVTIEKEKSQSEKTIFDVRVLGQIKWEEMKVQESARR